MTQRPTVLPQPTLLVVNQRPDPITHALARLTHFQVETLHYPEHLIATARHLKPDMILLSVDWPDDDDPRLDSFRLCAALKAEHAARFMPVILTDIATEQQADACLDCGADDLLPYGPDAAQVVARVRLMLRYKRLNEDHHRDLKQALETERTAKEMIEMIISGTMHELKTPLLHIKAAVSMLRSGDHRRDNETILEQAYQATGRLEERVNDLSELIITTRPRRLDAFVVSDMVNSVLRKRERLWTPIRPERIQFQIARVPFAYSDRAAVTQILLQLIDNALKFSANHQPVIVSVATDARDSDMIRIAVQDFGVGIYQSELDRIWDLFWQAESSTTRRFGGMGVGLALVKRLADSLNMAIEIESEPSSGTTVSFVIPVAHL